MGSVTLSEARKAKAELDRLQQAAEALPALEAQQFKNDSEAHLKQLKQVVESENEVLYAEYQESYNAYLDSFRSIVEAMKKTSVLLKRLVEVKLKLLQNASRFGDSWAKHQLEHNKQDAIRVAYERDLVGNSTIPGRVDRPLVPETGNAALDSLARLIEYF